MNIIGRYISISLKKYFYNKLNGIMVIIDTVFSCCSIWLFWYSLIELNINTANWDKSTIKLFIGFSIISKAFSNLTIGDYDIQQSILNGSLDLVLIKPVNSILFILMERPDYLQFITTFSIGVIYTFANSGGLKLINICISIIICIISTLIVYMNECCIYILAFWLRKVDSTANLYFSLISCSKYPLLFMSKRLLGFCTYVVPIAFIGTLPAEFAKGEINWNKVLWLFILFGISILMLYSVWQMGKNRYESAN